MASVRPEEVIKILKKQNVHISLEQARLVLDFMFKFVKLTSSQNSVK
jgi:hypothetical protein